MMPTGPAFSAPSAAICAPGPPQWAEVKPMRSPFLSWPMVVRVHMVSPLTTMPAPPPSGSLSSAAAVFAGRHTTAKSTAANAAAKRLCAVCNAMLPSYRQTLENRSASLDDRTATSASVQTAAHVKTWLTLSRRPWCWLASYGTAPHGNMNRDASRTARRRCGPDDGPRRSRAIEPSSATMRAG